MQGVFTVVNNRNNPWSCIKLIWYGDGTSKWMLTFKIILYYIILYYIILYYIYCIVFIVLYCIVLWYVVLCCVVLCCVVLCCVVLCCVVLCCVVLCCVVLCCVMLCYVMLYYVILYYIIWDNVTWLWRLRTCQKQLSSLSETCKCLFGSNTSNLSFWFMTIHADNLLRNWQLLQISLTAE